MNKQANMKAIALYKRIFQFFLLSILASIFAACGGNPAPEPPPVVAETVPEPDADSLAAAVAHARAAAVTDHQAITRRGPMRSARYPTTGWLRA